MKTDVDNSEHSSLILECTSVYVADFCKKIAEEPQSSNVDSPAERSHDDAEDESVFMASTLKAVTAASIIMNIRVS